MLGKNHNIFNTISLRQFEESETRRVHMRLELEKQMQEKKDLRERLEEQMRVQTRKACLMRLVFVSKEREELKEVKQLRKRLQRLEKQQP